MDPQLFESISQKFTILQSGQHVDFSMEELEVLRGAFAQSVENSGNLRTPIEGSDLGTRDTVVDLRSAVTGFCYVSFVRLLPSYLTSPFPVFESAVHDFSIGLGPEPKGTDILINLCLLEQVLSGANSRHILRDGPHAELAQTYLDTRGHIRTVSLMSESDCTFDFQEHGGKYHVTFKARCKCGEIMCRHGWSARFMLQLIGRDNRIIGADIDMSQLFLSKDEGESNQTTPLSAFVDKTRSYPSEALNRPYPQDPNSRPVPHMSSSEMREVVSKDLSEVLSSQLNARTEALELLISDLMRERQESSKAVPDSTGTTSASETQDSQSDVESTLMPIDSSSVVGRYNKRFMRSGTVYKVQRSSTVLEPLVEAPLRPDIDIVQGYRMTESMANADKASRDKIYAINGLASPFKNARLNFLIHFHTAIATSGFQSNRDPFEALEYVASMRPKNTTEELIKQCINRTFDFEELTIISNPFKLPYIEVGMLISDAMLVSCLTLLQNEYKALWFQEMKCLKVPTFHDTFKEFSSHVSSRERSDGMHRRKAVRSKNETKAVTEAPNARRTQRDVEQPRRNRGSILGISL